MIKYILYVVQCLLVLLSGILPMSSSAQTQGNQQVRGTDSITGIEYYVERPSDKVYLAIIEIPGKKRIEARIDDSQGHLTLRVLALPSREISSLTAEELAAINDAGGRIRPSGGRASEVMMALFGLLSEAPVNRPINISQARKPGDRTHSKTGLL
jgi:hypothetical protein